jgi:hypothetical protein
MPDDVEISVPPHLQTGVYANTLSVWHTRSEFTLDFLARPADRDEPEVALVVSRVKIPTMIVFELIRRLNDEMSAYESKYGELPT